MATPPSFSQQSRIARAVLYGPYNDVTILVEDESAEHLHLTVFQRLLGTGVKITQVFGLGGKTAVLAAHQAYVSGAEVIKGPCVFVCDRDLDEYLGIIPTDDDRLIYLDRYCIENYLIEETGVLKTVQWKVRRDPDDVKSQLKFPEWLQVTSSAFLILFAAFVMCRKYNLGTSVQLGPYRFLDRNGTGHNVDENAVAMYIESLRTAFSASTGRPVEDFDNELTSIQAEMLRKAGPVPHPVISGKYLLATLRRYIGHFFQCNFDEALFVGLLANTCDFSPLDFVRDRIMSVLHRAAS